MNRISFEKLEDVLMNIGSAGIFLMALLVTIDVIARYVFGNPIQGIHEVVEYYLMPAAIFFALGQVQRKDSHIRVDILYNKFDDITKHLVELGYRILMLGILALLIQNTTKTAIGYIQEGQSIYGLNLPLGYSWIFLPVGFTILFLQLGIECIEYVQKLRQHGER